MNGLIPRSNLSSLVRYRYSSLNCTSDTSISVFIPSTHFLEQSLITITDLSSLAASYARMLDALASADTLTNSPISLP